MAIIAIVGDIHSNSTVALAPPRVRLDDGGEYVSSAPQRWIWRKWLEFWKEVEEKRETAGGQLATLLERLDEYNQAA